MKLTIALQSEMKVISVPDAIGGNFVVEIPDECARDLWEAQISYWLENKKEQNKLTDSGYLRMKKKKIHLERKK